MGGKECLPVWYVCVCRAQIILQPGFLGFLQLCLLPCMPMAIALLSVFLLLVKPMDPIAVLVLQPLANVAFRRALAEFRSRDPMDPQELSREVKSLCDAMWEEVNTEPDCSASKTVMEKLLKLSRLSHRRLKLDG